MLRLLPATAAAVSASSLVPLVHEEVLIPKSFKILVDDRYTGTVNGIRLPEGAIMVDDTNPDEQIIHIMLSNKQLLQLAEEERRHLEVVENIYAFMESPRTYLAWGEFANLEQL